MASSLRPLTLLARRQAPLASSSLIRVQQRSILPSTYTSIRKASNMSLTTLDASQHPSLPASSYTLFAAKAKKKVSFETIAEKIGRNEVATASLFYGQSKASPEDIKALAEYFEIPHETLEAQMGGFPDRGKSIEMPPKEPLIYRLYEIVQNYGYAYKAVLNEKFGDGIMSAIAFSTKVEKETDKDGVVWVNIHMRGKWLPFTRF